MRTLTTTEPAWANEVCFLMGYVNVDMSAAVSTVNEMITIHPATDCWGHKVQCRGELVMQVFPNHTASLFTRGTRIPFFRQPLAVKLKFCFDRHFPIARGDMNGLSCTIVYGKNKLWLCSEVCKIGIDVNKALSLLPPM